MLLPTCRGPSVDGLEHHRGRHRHHEGLGGHDEGGHLWASFWQTLLLPKSSCAVPSSSPLDTTFDTARRFLERLRSLQMRKGGDDGALAQAATALLANVEAVDVDPTAAVVAADHHERYVCRADVQPRFDGVPRWLRCVSSVWSA